MEATMAEVMVPGSSIAARFYCTDCGCIDGKTHIVEIIELDYAYGIEVCLECGSENTLQFIRVPRASKEATNG